MPVDFAELRARVKAFVASPNQNEAFSVLKQVMTFVNMTENSDAASLGQELVIRLLEARDGLGPFAEILDGLVREVGLFPYLAPEELNFSDALAYEFHRPAGMDGNTVFHRAQAEVYRLLMAGESVVLSAPTSFGKSLVIDAVIASGIHKNIVIVVPTLALLDETRRRLAKFRNRYHLITHSSQTPTDANIFIHTQERVIENKNITSVDFFVIDEFYKLNPDVDQERADTLNHAFYKLARLAKQFYMLGPNIQAIPDGFKNRYRCTFIRTDYSTVVSETHVVGGGDRDEKAVELCRSLHDPTIVYCASPRRVRVVGKLLMEKGVRGPASQASKMAADWIRDNFHPDWSFPTLLEAGIGLHHGQLPRSLAQLVVRLFNKGEIRYLLCTSTLIEGVNTKAKNIVILDNKLATKKYNYFTFNNIRGRSGRMREHYVGHVYLFHEPPQQELPLVDIPVYTQVESATDGLLIQIDSEDIHSLSAKQRVEPYYRQDVLSIETLKSNTGIPPQAQLELARALLATPQKFHQFLSWHRKPNWDQLVLTCETLWTYFIKNNIRSSVVSGRQLAFLLNKVANGPSLEEWVAERGGGEDVDADIEQALDFIRQWAQYRAPKLLMALNAIQVEIFTRVGLQPGNYESFIARIETLGRDPVVMALDEYGIPFQIGEKIWAAIGRPDQLDAALQRLREVDMTKLGLTHFETDLMLELQPTL